MVVWDVLMLEVFVRLWVVLMLVRVGELAWGLSCLVRLRVCVYACVCEQGGGQERVNDVNE